MHFASKNAAKTGLVQKLSMCGDHFIDKCSQVNQVPDFNKQTKTKLLSAACVVNLNDGIGRSAATAKN
jgi:hypothetical protein